MARRSTRVRSAYKPPPNTVRARVLFLLSPLGHKASVEQMANKLHRRSSKERRDASKAIEASLRDRLAAHDEANRVFLSKALVALLPESFDSLSRLLTLRGSRAVGELHFSIFVVLSDAHRLTLTGRDRRALLSLMQDYLMMIRSQAGRAAWMLGDALGDHWPLEESLPILLQAARQARYVPGREGALHGLSHALERAEKQSQWRIMAALQQVSTGDRSERVKRYAEAIMDELRGL